MKDQYVIVLLNEIGYRGVGLRVYDSHHSILAVITLTAVVPDGLCIVDHDGVGGHHGGVWLHGHEAGEETGSCWHVVLDGLTRLIECGLDDAVVL